MENERDDDGALRRAGKTKPLSLGNMDGKLFARALKYCLEDVVDELATQIQRGFIRGRRMFKNIVDIEMEAMRISVTSKNGALVLFDFGAAFPSLSHELLWEVMWRIGIPTKTLKAVQALYQDN